MPKRAFEESAQERYHQALVTTSQEMEEETKMVRDGRWVSVKAPKHAKVPNAIK